MKRKEFDPKLLRQGTEETLKAKKGVEKAPDQDPPSLVHDLHILQEDPPIQNHELESIMRRADRLASLEILIASLAHEIRNPLAAIKTFTQLLPERMDDEEFRTNFLKVTSGEIDRLIALLDELGRFVHPSEPNPKEEDVNVLIDKMGLLLAAEARRKNIRLSQNFAPHLPLVRVDAEKIKQVLLNVLLNAIQAMPGGGQVWMETQVLDFPCEGKTEPFLRIEVRDSGVGIPKENIDRVFDPFFSTRPGGSGLGLAISRQIIHEQGGSIEVQSETEKGTSFFIYLPVRKREQIDQLP